MPPILKCVIGDVPRSPSRTTASGNQRARVEEQFHRPSRISRISRSSSSIQRCICSTLRSRGDGSGMPSARIISAMRNKSSERSAGVNSRMAEVISATELIGNNDIRQLSGRQPHFEAPGPGAARSGHASIRRRAVVARSRIFRDHLHIGGAPSQCDSSWRDKAVAPPTLFSGEVMEAQWRPREW